MDVSTISELKKELKTKPQEEVVDILLRIAKFKKDNKELLHYVLFEEHNLDDFIGGVKKEVQFMFSEINTSSIYFVKKSIRKILRFIKKNIQYAKNKKVDVELLLFFCEGLELVYPINRSSVLMNIYEKQYDLAKKASLTLHEDVQYDYDEQFEKLKYD